MTTDKTAVVERDVWIAARPETVFPFFTDPAKMVQWKGAKAELNATPGGIYRVDINGKDIARGEYVAIEPHTRVVFTWGWEGAGNPVPPGASTVEVTLTPEGEGTRVRLRHSGLTMEQAEAHTVGWEHYLPRLVDSASGKGAGPDPWANPAKEM